MEVKFEKASLDDVEEIIKLCNECFGESTPIDYAKEVFIKNQNDENQIYLIGKYNDEIIAHTKINIIPTIYQPMQTSAIINHVCVKQSYRRHNIATKMLDEIFKICKENNCVKVELWSNNFREAAHACYKHYGFQVDDAKFFSKVVE